jgi:adenosine deaminase
MVRAIGGPGIAQGCFSKIHRFRVVAVLLAAGFREGAAQAQSREERKASYLESVHSNPLLLNDFLARMPKGGDLDYYLTGAVYAESYIDHAAADGLCIERSTIKILPPLTVAVAVAVICSYM